MVLKRRTKNRIRNREPAANPLCLSRRFVRARDGWGKHKARQSRGAFPLGRPRPWMSAAVLLQNRIKNLEKDADMKTRMGVGDDGWPSPAQLCWVRREADARGEEELGGGTLSPPKQMRARASRPQAALVRKSTLPRHLGASSPSGNVRGGCRGWTPWAGRIPWRYERRHHIGFVFTSPRRPFLFGTHPRENK